MELNEWEYRFKTPELLQKEFQLEEEKRVKYNHIILKIHFEEKRNDKKL